jgi:hypothetical protein
MLNNSQLFLLINLLPYYFIKDNTIRSIFMSFAEINKFLLNFCKNISLIYLTSREIFSRFKLNETSRLTVRHYINVYQNTRVM